MSFFQESEKEHLVIMPLEDKISYSKKIIKEALDRFGNGLVIAWTGGKDSTTMLWLFHNICSELNIKKPPCMFIDEGDVFDEILKLVDLVSKEWDVDVKIAKNNDVFDKVSKRGDLVKVSDLNERNRQELIKIGFFEETFPFEPESYVGNHLMKTVAMNVFLEENNVNALATAIRWDEHEARKAEEYFSIRKNPDHTRIHPLLHFRERDIWNTIHKFKIPFCSLYFHGYRSLGAKCSTFKFSDIPAWEQDLENTTERGGRGQDKEAIMSQLRDLGYM